MHDLIIEGFLKEAGLANALRSAGRGIVRGSRKIIEGFTSAGRSAGELAGKGVGHGVGGPVYAGGKAVELAGKAIRGAENRVRGAQMGADMGGVGLRRALREGRGLTPKARERIESKYKGQLDFAERQLAENQAELVSARTEAAAARAAAAKAKAAPGAVASESSKPAKKRLGDIAPLVVGGGLGVAGGALLTQNRGESASPAY